MKHRFLLSKIIAVFVFYHVEPGNKRRYIQPRVNLPFTGHLQSRPGHSVNSRFTSSCTVRGFRIHICSLQIKPVADPARKYRTRFIFTTGAEETDLTVILEFGSVVKNRVLVVTALSVFFRSAGWFAHVSSVWARPRLSV